MFKTDLPLLLVIQETYIYFCCEFPPFGIKTTVKYHIDWPADSRSQLTLVRGMPWKTLHFVLILL